MNDTAIQEAASKWKYSDGDVSIFPFVDEPGALFPENFLADLYLQSRNEGLIPYVFPGMGPMTMGSFISYFHNIPMVVGVVQNPDNANHPFTVAGYGWLFSTEGVDGARKATCGYCYFRKTWGTDDIRKIARLALSYWFTEFKVDVIYGAALKTNSRAHQFDREMGFNKVADLPKFFCFNGKLEDAVLVMNTKEAFIEQQSGKVV